MGETPGFFFIFKNGRRNLLQLSGERSPHELTSLIGSSGRSPPRFLCPPFFARAKYHEADTFLLDKPVEKMTNGRTGFPQVVARFGPHPPTTATPQVKRGPPGRGKTGDTHCCPVRLSGAQLVEWAQRSAARRQQKPHTGCELPKPSAASRPASSSLEVREQASERPERATVARLATPAGQRVQLQPERSTVGGGDPTGWRSGFSRDVI